MVNGTVTSVGSAAPERSLSADGGGGSANAQHASLGVVAREVVLLSRRPELWGRQIVSRMAEGFSSIARTGRGGNTSAYRHRYCTGCK